MSEAPSMLLALAAGLLSFASPCVLPLVPSYLSYVGGVSIGELREGSTKRLPMLVRTALFVFGFGLVFVVLGILFSGSGLLFAGVTPLINLVAGGIVILLGLNILFDFWGFLQVERRFHTAERPRGYLGSMLVGMAFGAGWTPCIGPILAGILFLAGQSSGIGQGALLLSAYSLGLGLPFLAAAFFFPQVGAALQRIKRHLPRIKVASGLFLIGIGLLIALGRFQQLNAVLMTWGSGLSRWQSLNPAAARLTMSLLFALTTLLLLLPWLVQRLRSRDKAVSVPHPAVLTTALLFAVLALLQALAVVDLVPLVAAWLTYQGV